MRAQRLPRRRRERAREGDQGAPLKGGLPRRVLASGFVGGLLACTTAQPPAPAKPDATASGSARTAISASAAPASPSPPSLYDVEGWAKSWPKTWTDPRVVDALANKCDFVPESSPPGGEDQTRPADLFRCAPAWAQSCNPDPCIGFGESCERTCIGKCVDCGGACAKSCETCKAGCADGSCKRSCAQTCAECKQSCIASLDRCTTGGCGGAHAACSKKVRASWKANACPGRCKRLFDCESDCGAAKDQDACKAKCDAAVAPGWKACSDKCEALRAAKNADEASVCLAECYQKVPCAPDLCHQLGLAPDPPF